ncbi:hypothetical protein VTK56DRAFT_2940 [Thermocarpiscus australiensis]
MSGIISITSSAQWRQVLSTNTIVIADFYADWCGPCKMIAPTFASLAARHAKPRRIAFCKVDVDAQPDVARQYGVRAMPTFLVLRDGAVVDTVQGANPPALAAAVERAAKLAGGPGTTAAAGAAFASPGHKLGGSAVGGGGAAARVSVGKPMGWSLKGFVDAVIAFFGLYFVSLFSLDPYKAAENSPFNRKNPPPRVQSGSGTRPAARPGFKTLADLGS